MDLFDFADEFGPAKIIHVYEPSVGLKGILVVDNVAMRPSIGGVRIAPDLPDRARPASEAASAPTAQT